MVTKRLLLAVLLMGIAPILFAQSNGSVKTVSQKDRKCFNEGYHSASPVAIEHTHLYLKSKMNPVTPSGSRAITTVPLGTAGNLFTILDGGVNRIAANGNLNTVTFIHRTDPTVFAGNNIGQYRYDVSYDNGATWSLNHGVLNPSGNQLTMAGRYPNCVIHNPVGNIDSDSAYIGYMGAWLPFDAGGSWDGVWAGVARLDNAPSTFTEISLTPNNGNVNIPRGLCNGVPGVFWAVDWAWDEVEVSAILIYKGTWSDVLKDITWVLHDTIVPPFDRSNDGTAQATALNVSFDLTGLNGWIGFVGDIEAGGNNSFDPSFYRTTDGGDTWTGPLTADLQAMDSLVARLTVSPDPTTAFDADMAVDLYGNPHFLVVTGSEGAGQAYSISTPNSANFIGNYIYDITYTPGTASGCDWTAILVDSIFTFRGDFTTDVTEDNRPQVSISEDGKKVFFGWLDSDPSIALDGSNTLPNLKTKALDVTTGLATPVVNWTESDVAWSGQALFASFGATAIKSGATYSVPTAFTKLNISGLDSDPTSFFYVQNIQYQESDFTQPVMPPFVTLLGDNPLIIDICNNSFSDPGAVAVGACGDSLTISISGSVPPDSTGTFSLTYTATEGSITRSVTRQVQVTNDVTPPVITLTDGGTSYVYLGESYVEPGATSLDNCDSDLTSSININSTNVNPAQRGIYSVTYTSTDSSGNSSSATRTVVVNTEPDPHFTYTINGGLVNFTDGSFYEPTVRVWSFGDGAGSGLLNPSHNYTQNGVFQACLEVSNAFNSLFSKPAKSVCETITIIASGIEETPLDKSFRLFPNPTHGMLNIEITNFDFTELNISVHNLLGKELLEMEVGNSFMNSRQVLDLSTLPESIYLVRIKTDKGVVTKKVSLSSGK